MIAELNQLIDAVEQDLAEDLDVAEFVARIGTTEYHVRRMFSSLAGTPLSEYVRRRRMTAAAAAVVSGEPLLDVAVRSQTRLRPRLWITRCPSVARRTLAVCP